MIEFKPMPKIPRYRGSVDILEKIDGTNASIWIWRAEEFHGGQALRVGDYYLAAGSRTRWITPEDDNFGFARWVYGHAEELLSLGPGAHFGEWWGKGIQRGYGLHERRFSLFRPVHGSLPGIVHVVPTLYQGPHTAEAVEDCLRRLREGGSVAAPGYMNPEGVIIRFERAQFKVTLDGDTHKHAQAVRSDT